MPGHYSDEDKKLMIVSHKALNKSRLQELIDFIKVAGFAKIGIANCFSMQKYALRLKEILEGQGFEVYMINCKESGLQGSDICDMMSGSCCDPVSQAEYLNALHCDFNINVGLCLGHGLLFAKYSKAPVTTFVVKDPATKHKSVENLL